MVPSLNGNNAFQCTSNVRPIGGQGLLQATFSNRNVCGIPFCFANVTNKSLGKKCQGKKSIGNVHTQPKHSYGKPSMLKSPPRSVMVFRYG